MEAMEVLWDLSWRVYPAASIAVAGLWLLRCGLPRLVTGIRLRGRRPEDLLTGVRGFRRSVLGLALLGLAAAWVWHVPWLLAAALVIGLEETWESSAIFAALRGGPSERPRWSAPSASADL